MYFHYDYFFKSQEIRKKIENRTDRFQKKLINLINAKELPVVQELLFQEILLIQKWNDFLILY